MRVFYKEKSLPILEIDRNNHRHRLNYELIEGDTAKPYLVFLHEGLGCIAMWKDFPNLLCRNTGYRGLIYDRLGYGKSSPLSKPRTIHYLHEYALRELPEFLERVIPDTPFILIGHSDGGSISLIFGAERSFLLKGIISEAAHVFVDHEAITGIKKADAAWAEGKLKGLSKYHREKTEIIFKAWSETWLTEWFRHWNIEYLLPSIEVPMLVLHGENDQYGSIDQAKAIASKASGIARLQVVENCAHVPHFEAQSVVLGFMSDFITQVTEGG
jgi:pimeloyl-ACP methyl ester carboxylesterase